MTTDARNIRVGDHIGIRGAGGAISHRTMRPVGRGFMIEVTYTSGGNANGTVCVGGVEITQTGRRRASEQQRTVLIAGADGGQWNMIRSVAADQERRPAPEPEAPAEPMPIAPRGEVGITRPNRDGDGWSRHWTRVVNGALYGFTAVAMPTTGDLRYIVTRFAGDPAAPVKFGHEWKLTHSITIKALPLDWSRPRPGRYLADGYEVIRDPNAGRDNMWSLRKAGSTVAISAHRLLKSAQKRAAHLARLAAVEALIERIDAAEQAMYGECNGMQDQMTMGIRPRRHAGPMRTYEFSVDGARVRLCEGHGDMYGHLARVVIDEPAGSTHYTRDGATAGCGEMNSTDQLTSREATVNCSRCKARIAAARDVRNGRAYPTPVEAITAHYRAEREWPTAAQVVRRGAYLDELAGALDRGEVERAEDFTRDGGDCWVYRLPEPDADKPLAVDDVVTVDPLRRSRQYDVIAVDDIDGVLVRVAPRNPVSVDDAPRWVSREYTHRVPAELVEPVEDDDQADTEPTEGTMRMTVTPSGQAKIAAHLAARNTEPLTITYRPAVKMSGAGLVEAVCSAGDYTSAPTSQAEARRRGEAHLHDRHGVEPRGTVADLLRQAMPEQYRRYVGHLLAPFGFAPHTGRVPADADADVFLLHEPTGLAVGTTDTAVRLSYPAEHAGEGDGDTGTAWLDLAYGTSFETVAEVAIGLSQRLDSLTATDHTGAYVWPEGATPFDPGTGPMPGYVAGLCGHRVAASEWVAGFRVCERDAAAEARVDTYVSTTTGHPAGHDCPACAEARETGWSIERSSAAPVAGPVLPAGVADYRQPLTEHERAAGVVDPWHRDPYVGEGADGARRSAQIDREEADTLPADSERRAELIASVARWEDQARAIEAAAPATVADATGLRLVDRIDEPSGASVGMYRDVDAAPVEWGALLAGERPEPE